MLELWGLRSHGPAVSVFCKSLSWVPKKDRIYGLLGRRGNVCYSVSQRSALIPYREALEKAERMTYLALPLYDFLIKAKIDACLRRDSERGTS
jgi:hypothetical protein